MKSVILARVSTEEQKDAGNSLPAQIKRMREYCSRKGIEVSEEFSFDESAYKLKRNELDAILRRIYKNKDKIAVCFDKVDRFSRNVFDKRVAVLYELAMKDQIELHFASDNLVITSNISATEKFHFGINLGLAKYYSDAISDNTRRAFEQKRRNGEITGPPPIGYRSVPLDPAKRTRSNVVLDPETAHIVRLMFELYATGQHSINTLWAEAKRHSLRGKNGKIIARSVIETILKNEFYYGVAYSRKYNKRYPHRYETLISKELFEQCQQVLRGRARHPSKLKSRPFVFQGIVRCKKCGCLMSPELKKGRYIYYSCTNARKDICSEKVFVREEVLLEQVGGVFSAFGCIPEDVQQQLVSSLRMAHEGEKVFHRQELNRIQLEYDRTQSRIDNLINLRLDQSITPDDYDRKLQELKDQQYHLGLDLERHTRADHQYHIHVGTVLSLARRVGEIFESSEIEEKRAILNFLLQNPVVEGKKLEFSLKKPFDTVLELATCPIGLRGQGSNL